MSDPVTETSAKSEKNWRALPLEDGLCSFELTTFELKQNQAGLHTWAPSRAGQSGPSTKSIAPTSQGNMYMLEGPPSAWSRRTTLVFVCLVSLLNGSLWALYPATLKAIEEDMGFSQEMLAAIFFAQHVVSEISCLSWLMAAPWAISGKWALVISTVGQGFLTCLQFWSTSGAQMLVLFGLSFSMMYSRVICSAIYAGLYPEPHQRKCQQLRWCTEFGRISCALLGTGMSRIRLWGVPGWRLAYATIGGYAVVVGLAMAICFGEVQKPKRSSSTISEDLATMRDFLRNKTFLLLLLQGFFGVQLWKAMTYRVFFFQTVGLPDFNAGLVHSIALLSVLFGAEFGFRIANALARKSILHGRIWVAEIAVFGSIPFAFLLYSRPVAYVSKTCYYTLVTVTHGLIVSWVGQGVNPAILTSIADGSKGELARNSHHALENCLGSVVYLIIPVLTQQVYGYNAACQTDDCATNNEIAIRWSLFWVSTMPHLCCGLAILLLHWSYPEEVMRGLSMHNSSGTQGNLMDFEETSTMASTLFTASEGLDPKMGTRATV